jgi:TatD DNase family protein
VRQAALWCPPENMLLETDAPFLAPVPHRGRPNQPSLVPTVGTFIADLRGEPVAQLAKTTTRNARLAFPGIAP